MCSVLSTCRRDSFITHRAFCDALAQESAARQPPKLISSAISSQLYGTSNNITLGISQVGAHISSIHDHNNNNQSSSDLLRLGGAARTGQFDHHILAPPHQTMHSPSSFFNIPESNHNNQNYHHQNKPFLGLIQMSDLNNNSNQSSNSINNSSPSGHNNNTLFNLPFLSTASNNSFTEHFNSDGSSFFSDHQTRTTSSAPSLFSTSSTSIISHSHMSATALLQKAAQMGASSSNNNHTTATTLLRSFGSTTSSSKSGHTENYGSIFGGNNNHHQIQSNLQDLMNSFAANGNNASIFESGSCSSSSAMVTGFEAYERVKNGDHQKLQGVSTGGSDRLTRDFLGVGQNQKQIVRSRSGGVSSSQSDHQQQQQQHQHQNQRGFSLSSLEAERNNVALSGQSFGGRVNFQ